MSSANKFNINAILKELGVDGVDDSNSRRAGAPKSPDEQKQSRRNRHTVDQAEQSFKPLPAVPSGQRSFTQNISVEADPAVPVPPPAAPAPTIGPALSDIYRPEPGADAGTTQSNDLGPILLARGIIDDRMLEKARELQRLAAGSGQHKCLNEILIELKVDEVRVQQVVADVCGKAFQRIDLDNAGGFDAELLKRLGPEFCKSHLVLPLRTELGRVVIGAVLPDQVFLWDEVRRLLGAGALKVVVVTPGDIKAALERDAQANPHETDYTELLASVEGGDVELEKIQHQQEVNLEQIGNESPVIAYVNSIIHRAMIDGASDIHIEPTEKRLNIRFRIDGVLYDGMKKSPQAGMAPAITSRIKIMANLDISERRLPQDGRIRCKVQGRNLDLRVSTLPNTYGEKVVMRILDTKSIDVNLDQLGFSEDALTIWRKQINEPHGIVLVTGPTGSGKTTTLYASLRTLDKEEMNISTVEDPVEYHLDGVTQTQMHEKIGMTFARALKALLRQDPDVIMLGEIRDQETAHTAVQAALTGHLVLSTLHTNDAPSSITRLVNIGLEPFLVGAAVRAVLAQRLVRKLCQHCKKPAEPSEQMTEYLQIQGVDPRGLWDSGRCDKCRQRGYSGRLGIYELLPVDDQLRDIIARNPNVSEFRKTCLGRGMVSLRQDGIAKVAKGLTTVEEVFRATESAM